MDIIPSPNTKPDATTTIYLECDLGHSTLHTNSTRLPTTLVMVQLGVTYLKKWEEECGLVEYGCI
jgi:hypothetical protein